jgi:biopolymer transport protein ExbD
MAEIQEKGNGKGKKGGSKQKKMNVRIDFTPMVDMNMLLITFFMLCTSLSKPQTMEISMPTNDKVSEAEQNKVKASKAITLILGKDNKVYYYLGQPKYDDLNTLKKSSFKADGLRAMLLGRNTKVTSEINELKKQKLKLKISDEQFREKAAKIKSDKSAPVVIIKASDESNYTNLIDALDEMQICNISKYAIVDITPDDVKLLKSVEKL